MIKITITIYSVLDIPKELYCNTEIKSNIEEVLEKILDEYQLVYHLKTKTGEKND